MPPFIQHNILLAPKTTLGVGGQAEFFADVHTIDELVDALRWAQNTGLCVHVLGGGSNVLISDNGVRGLVVHLATEGIEVHERVDGTVAVTAAAGVVWDDLVAFTTEQGLWGIENLSGIPGTVGAAPVQNINAYGVSVADSIESVTVCDMKTSETKVMSRDECQFGYRHSFFKTDAGTSYIITSVTCILTRKKAERTTYASASQSIARHLEREGITEPQPSDIRTAVLSIRRNIGMLPGMYCSAGSFFKNTTLTKEAFSEVYRIVTERHNEKATALAPWYWELSDGNVKVSTAFLMECSPYNKTLWSEKVFGSGVSISPRHSLSLINVGGATATDIALFAATIIADIEREFGVTIEQEVCIME